MAVLDPFAATKVLPDFCYQYNMTSDADVTFSKRMRTKLSKELPTVFTGNTKLAPLRVSKRFIRQRRSSSKRDDECVVKSGTQVGNISRPTVFSPGLRRERGASFWHRSFASWPCKTSVDGGYPCGRHRHFWGSNASLAAHDDVVNTWKGHIIFIEPR